MWIGDAVIRRDANGSGSRASPYQRGVRKLECLLHTFRDNGEDSFLQDEPMADPFFPSRERPNPVVLTRTGEPTLLMLTICTRARRRWLACEEAHALLRSTWAQATDWLVGRYVLMPDHLHCLAAANDPIRSVESWVRYWKCDFRKRHAHADWQWQSGVFHHRLRNHEQHGQKWRYVLENPVRAGLVTEFSAWPFQGDVFPEVRW